jgi:predicted permease
MTPTDFWLRLRSLVFRARVERELQEELDFHLAMQVRKNLREGLTVEDAGRRATEKFGHRSLVAEECRDVRRSNLVDQLLEDIRYALRASIRHPGFTFVAILTLGLGIGANTAIFSVVHAVLLRPLPYATSGRVVRVIEDAAPGAGSAGGPRRTSPVSVSRVPDLRAAATTLSHLGVHLPAIRTLTGHGDPVRIVGARVSPDIFSTLDARPLFGRPFEAHDAVKGAEPVVVLSQAAWQQYLGADPNVIGRTVSLDGQSHSVVGVMRQEFGFPDPRDQFWIPFVIEPSDSRRLPITARLRDGTTPATAAAEISTIAKGLRGSRSPAAPGDAPRIVLVPLLDLIVAPVRPALRILTAAVGFVLLIACVNVANLLIARGASRRREIAVRRALGAAPGRLVRQALTESVLLALAGGVLGVALAYGGIRLLSVLASSLPRRDLGSPTSLPRLEEIGMDASVLAYSIAISVVVGLVFGLFPALRERKGPAADALRDRGVDGVSGFNVFRRQKVVGALVITEIALAMVLFVGGGLLIHSFVRLTKIRLGYDPRNVVTFQVSLPAPDDGAALRGLADRLVERVQALPHVRSVGYVESLPMTRVSRRFTPLRKTPRIAGPPRPLPAGPLPPDMPDTQLVSTDFMSAMDIRLVEGRPFAEGDRPGHPQVMLINQTLARTGIFGAHPIGQRIYGIGDQPWEVIGIVEDIRQSSPTQTAEPQIFVDFRQIPDSEPLTGIGLYFAIRTDGDAGFVGSHIRRLAMELDPNAIVENVAPMDQIVASSIASRRLYAVLLGIFAGVAVLLASVGIYAVMAWTVAHRTHEIGIRMALGARRGQVMSLVLGQSGLLVAAGLALGLSGAAAVTSFLESLLFGVTPLDPITFFASAVLFVGVAMVASYIPARRATLVNPLVALRCE